MNVRELVRPDAVNSQVYTDPEIFDREMQRIFGTLWIYVAHESEVPEPGDYKTTRIGLEPVIVSRGSDDGVVRVFYNRCRHKGAAVCQLEKGAANYFRCAYHGWTYTNQGRLTGVPFPDGYGPDFKKEGFGLVPVASVGTYKGFIFATVNSGAIPFESFLDPIKEPLNVVADSWEGGIELSAGTLKYAFHGNWKLQLENTIDPYHLNFVHRSFYEVSDRRSGSRTKFAEIHGKERITDLGLGNSLYELATDIGIGTLPFNLLVFPSLGLVGSHVRVIYPVSVDYTMVHLYPIILKGAPAEVNRARLRGQETFYGSASFGTPDDMEVAFDRVTEGFRARGDEWLHVTRGLNREQHDEKGRSYGTGSDEVAMRAIYHRWLELMGEGDGAHA